MNYVQVSKKIKKGFKKYKKQIKFKDDANLEYYCEADFFAGAATMMNILEKEYNKTNYCTHNETLA